jgi:hypothetical protein
MMKRKRKTQRDSRVNKRQKVDSAQTGPPTWPLLRQYYPKVLTLRHFLVASLKTASKRRRRDLLNYGNKTNDHCYDSEVVAILDRTVVGTFDNTTNGAQEDLNKDITIFTQQLSEHSLSTISPTQGAFKQAEVGWNDLVPPIGSASLAL